MQTAYDSTIPSMGGDGDEEGITTTDQQSEISSIGSSTIMTGAAALQANVLAIAELILSKYGRLLMTGATTYSVSTSDKQYFDQIVHRDRYVDAIRFRLKKNHSFCPEESILQ